jgi:hypothetical protein
MDRQILGSFTVNQIGDESERVLEFVGTDETEDRVGDIVKADGWNFDNYEKNPVFMWCHDYSKPPLGKCVKISRAPGSTGTMFQIKFATIEELSSNPETPSEWALFADMIYMSYKNSYMKGVSVGIKGIEVRERDDQPNIPSWKRGKVFEKQSLIELSAAPIPMHQDALRKAMGEKLMPEGYLKSLESIMEATPEEDTVKAEDVQKMIGEATASLMVEVEALKAMSAVSTTKAGAKFSTATKTAITKALADMQACVDGYETHSKALLGAMGCIKGMMDGDGSEPEGNSTSETTPQTEENGDVPAPAKALGDFIDLETFVLK